MSRILKIIKDNTLYQWEYKIDGILIETHGWLPSCESAIIHALKQITTDNKIDITIVFEMIGRYEGSYGAIGLNNFNKNDKYGFNSKLRRMREDIFAKLS